MDAHVEGGEPLGGEVVMAEVPGEHSAGESDAEDDFGGVEEGEVFGEESGGEHEVGEDEDP